MNCTVNSNLKNIALVDPPSAKYQWLGITWDVGEPMLGMGYTDSAEIVAVSGLDPGPTASRSSSTTLKGPTRCTIWSLDGTANLRPIWRVDETTYRLEVVVSNDGKTNKLEQSTAGISSLVTGISRNAQEHTAGPTSDPALGDA
ncbi:hypothetical protein FRB99_001459 [Tulasnella sp. 403]|nr:hypothetical protein FRB99_001459 [Tulasnella sp. 403]